MYASKVILLLILLLSCRNESSDSLALLSEKLTLELATSQVVHLPASLSDLDFPPYLWRQLMRTENICLWYRTPSENEDGTLKLIPSDACEDYSAQELAQVHQVLGVKLSVRDSVVLQLQKTEQNHQLEFPLINVEQIHQGDRITSRIDEKKELSSSAHLINGKSLKLYNRPLSELGLYPKKGSIELSYQDKTAIFCHRFSDTCDEETLFTCDSCLGGWYEVVSHRCADGQTTKICGRDRCGQKGEPACPRGLAFMSDDDESWCFEGSRAGLCQDGLITSCDENQILICL
jgi:hypothetical protein